MADLRTDLPPPRPRRWGRLRRVARLAARPLERFLRIEAASGIVLFVAATIALAWANSPWEGGYARLWHQPLGVQLGRLAFERPLEWFVNDGLMVVFFFVVGMEIRRELHQGELSEWRRAALPAAAALGGMAVPALIFVGLAPAPETRSGWGVPMATDIAFALGVLALLGKRVPPALRVLLLALAVIDDLGAIVAIALFYSSGVAPVGLLVAAAGVFAVLVLKRLGVRSTAAYLAPGLVTWAGTYAAGIHPTIAGVVLGLLTPVVRTKGEVSSPAEHLIERLHPWVAFGVMPVFALANAGIRLVGEGEAGGDSRVVVAAFVGLVVGKPIGVLLATAAMLKLRLGALPRGLGARHLLVVGLVAGVGFTMALFIAQLAFTDARLLGAAKRGVLGASAVAAVLALVAGRLLLRPQAVAGAAESADQAERSTEV